MKTVTAAGGVKRKEWKTNYLINTIPKKSEALHDLYDLSFSMQLANNKWRVFGTGWLIDWKKPKRTHNLSEPFYLYLATNLHIAVALSNPKDYAPFNKASIGNSLTTVFCLGKYINPQLFKLRTDVSNAFVSIQTSTIPKTAFVARDFVPLQNRGSQWVAPVRASEDDPALAKSYLDFAIIEVPLFLHNQMDKQIYDHFMRPAINTYERLGNSVGIFAYQPMASFKRDSYFALGYPQVESNIAALNLNQTEVKPTRPEDVAQVTFKEPWSVDHHREIPTLTTNQLTTIKTKHFSGSKLSWPFDHTKSFKIKNKWLGQNYQMYGHGLGIDQVNLRKGTSSSLVINQKRQIVGIYFATVITNPKKAVRNDVGLVQMLRFQGEGNSLNPN